MTATVSSFWLECYLLNLPFDTGVPDDFVFHVKDEPRPIEEGWDEFGLGPMLGIAPEPTGQMTSTTLHFRRGTVRLPPPWEGASRAFPEVFAEPADATSPMEDAELSDLSGTFARTVVAATRIAAPPSREEESRWRGDQITASLTSLNLYLEALAGIRTNDAVGPVAAPDLPALLFGYRCKLEDPAAASLVHKERFALELHRYMPWATTTLSMDQARQAGKVVEARDLPLYGALSWLRSAERFVIQENSRHAIVDACTGIERAVSDVVHACGPAAGYGADKTESVLRAPFAARVKHHFARLLGFDEEPAQSDDPLGNWWRVGYAARNSVVHFGHHPSRAEAHHSVQAANRLLEETIDRVRADNRFSDVLPPA